MVKYILISLTLLSCTTYPKFKYKAIDNKGNSLTIHEYKGTYEEHQYSIGDTVVVHIQHGAYGQISNIKYDGRNLHYNLKNVIITELK